MRKLFLAILMLVVATSFSQSYQVVSTTVTFDNQVVDTWYSNADFTVTDTAINVDIGDRIIKFNIVDKKSEDFLNNSISTNYICNNRGVNFEASLVNNLDNNSFYIHHGNITFIYKMFMR